MQGVRVSGVCAQVRLENSYDYKLFSENRRVLYARYVIGALVNFT